MNWLVRIQAPRYYRYLFYKAYKLTASKNDTPVGNAVLTLSFANFCQILVLPFVLEKILLSFSIRLNDPVVKYLIVIGILLIFVAMNYIFFMYKEKWRPIVSEFEQESKSQKRRGTFYFIFYFIGSILFFVLCLMLFVPKGDHYVWETWW